MPDSASLITESTEIARAVPSSASAVVSSVSVSVTASALLPAASVTEAVTFSVPSARPLRSWSATTQPFPSLVASALTVFSPSVIATETLEASASMPDSDRVTFVDSAAFVTTSSDATETVKTSSRSAEVSSVSVSVTESALLPAASVTVALTVSVPSSRVLRSWSATTQPFSP